MGYEIFTGLVAREIDTGEADRYLTVLSAERGKLECYAKGIRKQKSKLASQAGLLSYGEFQMHESKDRRILTSAKSAEAFYGIRTDVIKCAYAMHFLEIARDVIVEAQAFPAALQTLLNSLYALCYHELAPDFISRVYEIRILSLAGFAPLIESCSICGERIKNGAGFAVDGDGAVCSKPSCKTAAGRILPISRGALMAIGYVCECEAGDIFKFKINGHISSELGSVIPLYLQHQFGKEYRKTEEAERYRAFEREMAKMRKEK